LAEEDLYLNGSDENTIQRVTAETTTYTCMMLKTQPFASLFRQYAKQHGLREEELEFCFVDPLRKDDTPYSVQLLRRGDTIMVRKRRTPNAPPEAAAEDDVFFKHMRGLLEDDKDTDCIFLLHPPDDGTGGVGMNTDDGKKVDLLEDRPPPGSTEI
jgi:hypothetical protein